MADSDKTLKLRVELDGYVMPGAAEAEAKLKTQADDLAKSMGVVSVSAGEADKIIKQTGESAAAAGGKMEESGQHTKAHAGHAREMHHVFSQLNHLVPGLGTALKAAFHPDSIGIISVVLAFEALSTVLENIKAIDEIKLADFTGDKAAVDAVREAYEHARVAAALFVDEQNRLNHAGASAEEVQKREAENYKNLASAQEQFNSARKKLGEAEIEEREKKGVITHAEALKEQFALDVAYAAQKLQLEAQTDAAQLASLQKRLAAEKAQLAAANADLATDEANAAATAAAKAKHDKRKETAEKNAESAKNTLEELGKSKGKLVSGVVNEETAGQLEAFYEKHFGSSAGKNHSEMFQELENARSYAGGFNTVNADLKLQYFLAHTTGSQAEFAKYDGAQQQLSGSKAEIKKLEETQFQVDLNAERAKKQLDATEETVRKWSASVDTLERQIPNQQADATARLQNSTAVQNMDLRQDAIKKGLGDPGNAFRAPTAPVMSTAHEEVTNPTPWRSSANGASLSAASIVSMVKSIKSSNDHEAIMAQLAEKLERSQAMHHETSLRILNLINQGLMKHESVSQIASQVEQQMSQMRNTIGSG